MTHKGEKGGKMKITVVRGRSVKGEEEKRRHNRKRGISARMVRATK